MSVSSILYQMKIAQARRVFERAKRESGTRYFGVENVTMKGLRRWSIAPVTPHKAIDALKGVDRAPLPPHLVTVWDSGKHAWRTLDLSTVRRIYWRGADNVKREYAFAG